LLSHVLYLLVSSFSSSFLRLLLFNLFLFFIAFYSLHSSSMSRDSSVGIATGYKLDGRGEGVRIPVRAGFFSFPRCPDRLWGPPNLLSNGYRKLFPQG
jgi:hypothetical protein